MLPLCPVDIPALFFYVCYIMFILVANKFDLIWFDNGCRSVHIYCRYVQWVGTLCYLRWSSALQSTCLSHGDHAHTFVCCMSPLLHSLCTYAHSGNAGIPRRRHGHRHRHRLAKHGYNLTSDTRYFLARISYLKAAIAMTLGVYISRSVAFAIFFEWDVS